jgi:hypothetical protein
MPGSRKIKSKLQQKSNLEFALKYARLGWSVIPMWEYGDQKKPRVKWEKWQNRRPSLNSIRKWWAKWPNANIGVVTGEISNLNVLESYN